VVVVFVWATIVVVASPKDHHHVHRHFCCFEYQNRPRSSHLWIRQPQNFPTKKDFPHCRFVNERATTILKRVAAVVVAVVEAVARSCCCVAVSFGVPKATLDYWIHAVYVAVCRYWVTRNTAAADRESSWTVTVEVVRVDRVWIQMQAAEHFSARALEWFDTVAAAVAFVVAAASAANAVAVVVVAVVMGIQQLADTFPLVVYHGVVVESEVDMPLEEVAEMHRVEETEREAFALVACHRSLHTLSSFVDDRLPLPRVRYSSLDVVVDASAVSVVVAAAVVVAVALLLLLHFLAVVVVPLVVATAFVADHTVTFAD
jgi:hypothetical protein